ncbi:MAG: M28 family metallopeptidase, partial [Solirubrobacteraceae bacterium]
VNPYGAPAAVLPTGRGPSLTGCSVWVSTDDGRALATMQGADVTLGVGDGIGPLHDVNVIAEIRGETDEVVIACAHYDAAAGAPGVIDNGAGISWLGRLLIEAAGSVRLRRTLRVCAFAAEEIGLIGARHHAQRAVLAWTKIAAVVNVDAIGAASALDLQVTPELYGVIEQLSAPLDELHDVTRRGPGPGSDHMAFHEQGVPVIAVVGPPSYPTYHQVEEDLDAIDRDRLRLAERVATDIALSLVDADG